MTATHSRHPTRFLPWTSPGIGTTMNPAYTGGWQMVDGREHS